jgi:hypothetical protein
MGIAEADPGALRLAQTCLPARVAGGPAARLVIQHPVFPIGLLRLGDGGPIGRVELGVRASEIQPRAIIHLLLHLRILAIPLRVLC